MTFYSYSIRSLQRRIAHHSACLLAPLMLALAAPLFAATIAVNSLADTTANDGVCTLREAIIAANTNAISGAAVGECAAGTAGLNVITFSVAGTMQPSSSMPNIVTPIHINGYTAPNAAKNTLPLSGGTNAQLKVEIDGFNAGVAPAFKLVGSAASGSIIEGLVINNSANPACCAQMGVYVSGVNGAATTIIRGNFFGTDITGTTARSKGSPNVYIDSVTANLVIGSSAGVLDDSARNLISGSWNAGVVASGNMTNLTIRGNLIGSNATGTAKIGNQIGIQLADVTNGVVADNLVSGNSADGIRLIQRNTAVSITRNLIGTNALGSGSMPNTSSGLFIFDRSNAAPFTIDNIDVAHNVVANNTCGGVGCSGGIVVGIANSLNTIVGVRLTRNLVYANKGQQIDLATPNGASNYVFGLTANDLGDADGGPGAPNNLQNFPVLSPATGNGSNISIPYAFNSEASKIFTLEFFQAGACDASGHGGANVYLGNATVSTDGSGNASGTVAFASVLTTGVVSATATNVVNGTSELSACAPLSSSAANVAPLIASAMPTSGTVGTAYTFQVVATGSAPISYSVGSGSLPPGVMLDATSGLLSGMPTTPGTFNGTIVASNGTLPNASQAFSIVISSAAAALPVLTLSDASVAEGNSGTSVMNFPLSLNAPAPVGGVVITYSTANGTTTAGSDYVAVITGTVTIPAGATTGSLPVTINGDTTVEADETFTVTMTNVTNATINGALAPKTTAIGTILNDDAIVPPIVVANATPVPVDSPWALLVVILGVIGCAVGQKRALKAKSTTQINAPTHV